MAENLYSRLMDDEHVSFSKQEHALFRNYLTLHTALRNGCRPGVIANMTVDEFSRMSGVTTVNGEQRHFLQVSNHKTSTSLGPAFCSLQQT